MNQTVFGVRYIYKVMERNVDYYLRGPYIRKNLSCNSNDVSRKKKFIADKEAVIWKVVEL